MLVVNQERNSRCRERRVRRVGFQPNFFYFEPRGSANSEVVVLRVEELESIRLKDYLKMEQGEAAERMDVSQPTFHRILHEVRRNIAEALVEGKEIRIEGGDYVLMLEGSVPAPAPSPVIPSSWLNRRRENGSK